MPVTHPLVKKPIIVGCLLVLGSTDMASGQTGPVRVPSDATAIVNVTVIPMDSERVNAGQTVLVRGDRISAIGAAGELAVPPGATVIDGAGHDVVLTAGGVAAFLRRWQSARPRPSAGLARIRVRAGIVVAAWVPAVVSATLFFPGGPLFDSVALRVAFTALILVAAAATVWLVVATVGIWRDANMSGASRVRAVVVSVASLAAV